jgi:hypothetical protein
MLAIACEEYFRVAITKNFKKYYIYDNKNLYEKEACLPTMSIVASMPTNTVQHSHLTMFFSTQIGSQRSKTMAEKQRRY